VAARRTSSRSSDETELPYLINLFANYVNESMRDDLRRAGMTVPRWTVLASLRHQDGQAIGDLARHCLIPQSSLTRVVDQLERDGQVERRHSPRDQRICQVWLTEQGRELYESTVPEAVERASAAVRQLITTEMDQLAELLERARDSLQGEQASSSNQRKRRPRTPRPRAGGGRT
jgi:DNA-binding MarR family transcriptional regulator